MASEAQILANRRNAEKSTGPRSVEGKAVVAQNAVRHGLTAQRDVIDSEDREEFDLHREQMFEELAPSGPAETALAERIVGLWWRLKRSERIQNEAFDYLLAKDTSGPAAKIARSLPTIDPTATDPALALGRTVVKDFSGARVLDRLMMYERRIEHSLYKTMAELQKLKLLRQMEAEERSARRLDLPDEEGPRRALRQRLYGGAISEQAPVDLVERQLCKTKPISADGGVWERPETVPETPPPAPAAVAFCI